ncbi:hypothetical protein HYQ46_003507 [Verticillium longisporum]|nr:hypothetical protein HYQ46_003507 [Verticillium longisporum]
MGDEDDAEEGDEGAKLLDSREGFAEGEVAGYAGDGGCQEGDDGGFGEGQIHHGVPHAVDAEEARDATGDEEPPHPRVAKGKVGRAFPEHVARGTEHGDALAGEEDLERMHALAFQLK